MDKGVGYYEETGWVDKGVAYLFPHQIVFLLLTIYICAILQTTLVCSSSVIVLAVADGGVMLKLEIVHKSSLKTDGVLLIIPPPPQSSCSQTVHRIFVRGRREGAHEVFTQFLRTGTTAPAQSSCPYTLPPSSGSF